MSCKKKANELFCKARGGGQLSLYARTKTTIYRVINSLPSGRLGEEIVGDPPLLPLAVRKGLGTGEKENAPAVENFLCLGGCLIILEDLQGGGFVLIEVAQPILGGFRVVPSRPSPAAFELEAPANPLKEFVRWHGAATKKMFGHPIVLPFDFKGIRGGTVAKYMSKKFSTWI